MTSPWAKVTPIQTMDFNEIQSEQYARTLQDKENAKFTKTLVAKQIINDNNFKDSEEKMIDVAGTSTSLSFNAKSIDKEHVLNTIKSEMPFNLEDFCDSDRIIAELMQAEFDRERDNELKIIERQANKDSKVSVSLKNYRTVPDELVYDSDEDQDLPDKPKNWDCFELNEKVMNNLPKKGFGKDEDGLMITKHDKTLCGIRNAGRVMAFPPDFHTGDAVDVKLSNAVFNQLKIYSRKHKRSRANDRRENISTAEMGVDEPTRIILYKLVSNQILHEINGIISTGKEAVILHAESDSMCPMEIAAINLLPKHCAIKIFKTTLNEFKQRDKYIKDDFRFKDRFSKQNSRIVINMWAEKEMFNLKRMKKYGIRCPEVVVLKKHVLVMSLIGIENIPAPKLKEAILNDAELIMAYDEMVDIMHRLYNEAKLIHADLSEYNILWHDQQCWLIDVAQSVEPEHPCALEFLLRDCGNISTFFTRRGVPNVQTKEELFTSITGHDANNVDMLERLYVKGLNVIEATAPNSDDITESLKPTSYPFDYAWEKMTESKLNQNDVDDRSLFDADKSSSDAGTSSTECAITVAAN